MKNRVNIAVMVFVVTATSLLVAPQATEAQDAEIGFDVVLQWLNIKGLTKYDTVVDFRKDDFITRGESAKFYTQFGVLFGLDKTYTACDFSDLV